MTQKKKYVLLYGFARTFFISYLISHISYLFFPPPLPKNPPRGVGEIGHLHIDNFRLNEYNTIDTFYY